MTDVLSDAARTYLHWALIEGVGPILVGRLIDFFGDLETALRQPPAALEQVARIGRKTADQIVARRDEIDLASEIEAAAAHNVRILCREDAEYPPALKRIPDPPIVLYVRGELRATDALALAIVGSRRCTIYGSEQARRFGELLAGAGFTVVSGMARGIDAFAHHGAVDAGGRSIAVMGRGLSEVYPPENQGLAKKLLEHGAWISELPIAMPIRADNFPSRNRIIAGLSLGTLVIEAADRSGALITARLSGEYNREVFAVPGRLGDPMSKGTNGLIRDGIAKLVTCLEDILGELGEVGFQMQMRQTAAAQPPTGKDGPAEKPRAAALSPIELRVFEMIGIEPILQDAVLSAAGVPPGEVLAAMTALELKGLIRRLPGQLVVRHGLA